VTSFSGFMQRSFLKFGGDVASLFPRSAVDGSFVRPGAVHGRSEPVAAARWIGHECFRARTFRPPANDNRSLALPGRTMRRSGGHAVRFLRPVEAVMAAAPRPDTPIVRPRGHSEIGRILVDGPIGSCVGVCIAGAIAGPLPEPPLMPPIASEEMRNEPILTPAALRL
jgi:hypothetical protein